MAEGVEHAMLKPWRNGATQLLLSARPIGMSFSVAYGWTFHIGTHEQVF